MVIDSSAIMVIFLNEPERRALIEAISFDREQALIARSAFHRFDKGCQPAVLNLEGLLLLSSGLAF